MNAEKTYKYPSKQQARTCGFTLLELMIVIAIIGIAVAIGAPSFQSNRADAANRAAQQSLYSAINLARSTALTTRSNVRVCASNDGTTCVCPATGCPATTAANIWSNGWLVQRTDGNNVTSTMIAHDVANRSITTNCVSDADASIVGNIIYDSQHYEGSQVTCTLTTNGNSRTVQLLGSGLAQIQ